MTISTGVAARRGKRASSFLPSRFLRGLLVADAATSAGAVWVVIAINAVWALDSILLLLTGWIDPTAPGYVFVIVQAAAVAIFAELQAVALRRAKAA